MNRTLVVLVISISTVLLGACCHGPKRNADEFRAVTVTQLLQNPAEYIGNKVAVTGFLKNAGENYFGDLRPVLDDGKGRFIAVSSWAPLEVPPPRPGPAGRERPKVMSDYLNRNIVLKGTWQQVDDKYILNVIQAVPEKIKEDSEK